MQVSLAIELEAAGADIIQTEGGRLLACFFVVYILPLLHLLTCIGIILRHQERLQACR